jgi:hypothetical protein
MSDSVETVKAGVQASDGFGPVSPFDRDLPDGANRIASVLGLRRAVFDEGHIDLDDLLGQRGRLEAHDEGILPFVTPRARTGTEDNAASGEP